MVGLEGLLNLDQEPHVTAVVTDGPLRVLAETVKAALRSAPTRVLHIHLPGETSGPGAVLDGLREHGVDLDSDYVSLFLLICTHASLDAVRSARGSLRRGDLVRLELPAIEMGFDLDDAATELEVIRRADYGEQDLAAATFFGMLARNRPYCVRIHTPGGLLHVRDDRPWFQLGGRLVDGESRILPGGEVAYTGDGIHGWFEVNAGLLATPQRPSAAALARALTSCSRRLESRPLSLRIEGGEIVEIRSCVDDVLAETLCLPEYRQVTEVGVSFNRACTRIQHTWPAASNEGCPGVHIGVGGDPDPETASPRPLVHLDLISRRCGVEVNGLWFLKLDA